MAQQRKLRTCPNIVGLTLDKDSLEAIGPILGTILKTGVNTVDAAGSAAGSVSYSIFSSNWEAFFFSYGGLQAHAQNQIEKVILKQALRSDSTPKERLFRGTLDRGCKAASKGK